MAKNKVKTFTIELDEDVYNIICVYLYCFRFVLKNGLSSTYSEVLREVFKEVNAISPKDSLLHYDSVNFDYILERLNNL